MGTTCLINEERRHSSLQSLTSIQRLSSVDKSHILHLGFGTMEAVSYTKRKLRQLNFFRDVKTIHEPDERILRDQILATRVYLPLLLMSFLIMVLFTSLSQRTVSVTVSSPSLAIYQRLQTDYPNTLLCPCRQIAINYGDFLSIMASYHQVMV